jgi:hypothetical protein
MTIRSSFASAEDLRKLQRAELNQSKALEIKTTRAICKDASMIKKFGKLGLLNEGGSVTFFASTDLKNPFMEVDGLIKNRPANISESQLDKRFCQYT